jgi:hypothetical protein
MEYNYCLPIIHQWDNPAVTKQGSLESAQMAAHQLSSKLLFRFARAGIRHLASLQGLLSPTWVFTWDDPVLRHMFSSKRSERERQKYINGLRLKATK